MLAQGEGLFFGGFIVLWLVFAAIALAGLAFWIFMLRQMQSNGGKGLTLMDVDKQSPLISVATCADALKVLGTGRGGKPKEEDLKWAALAEHQGKRARKGRKVDGLQKVLRVLA